MTYTYRQQLLFHWKITAHALGELCSFALSFCCVLCLLACHGCMIKSYIMLHSCIHHMVHLCRPVGQFWCRWRGCQQGGRMWRNRQTLLHHINKTHCNSTRTLEVASFITCKTLHSLHAANHWLEMLFFIKWSGPTQYMGQYFYNMWGAMYCPCT